LSAPSSLASFDFQTNKISLLPIPQPVVDVDFSPDGQWVTYETTDTKNPDIYIFPLLIGSAQRLTSSPQNDFDPVWRPGK
jgi:Tol biopolymer transport system component